MTFTLFIGEVYYQFQGIIQMTYHLPRQSPDRRLGNTQMPFASSGSCFYHSFEQECPKAHNPRCAEWTSPR